MVAKRIILYCLGVVLMALGFILSAKSNLGITPINSIAYCVSVITGTSFADMTMLMFIIMFFVSMIIRRKKPHWTDYLQLPYSFLFARCMSAFSAILPSPDSLVIRIIFIIVAVMCVATGAAMSLAMHVVPNPADYLVNVIGNKIKKPLGFAKNIVDVGIVCLSVIVGLIAGLSLQEAGVFFGTIYAMIFSGRFVAVVNHFFLDKFTYIYEHGYIKIFDEKDDEAVAR